MIHTVPEPNRIPQTTAKDEISARTYHDTYHILNESHLQPKPKGQLSAHKKKAGLNKRCPSRNRNKGMEEKKSI